MDDLEHDIALEADLALEEQHRRAGAAVLAEQFLDGVVDEPGHEEDLAKQVPVVEKQKILRCKLCGASSYNLELLKFFNTIVCNPCKKEHVEMVTKGTAKADFLCTDGDLLGLKFVERSNPKKPGWNAMKLYLKSEIEAIALKKYTDAEGLVEAKRNREVAKLEKRIKANKKKRESNEPRLARKPAKKTKKQISLEKKAHTHDFEDGDGCEVCRICGFTVEVITF